MSLACFFVSFRPKYRKLMISRASVSYLEKVHNFLICEIYSLTPKVKYLGGKKSLFANSKICVIFESHLGNGGHIEKLHDFGRNLLHY